MSDAAVVAVVVVNWNDADASRRALCSVPVDGQTLAILVDNGSDADPEPALRADRPDAVVVHRPSNGGYAAAANDGAEAARRAGATHVLLLNNDAVLAPGAVDALVEFDRRHPGRILAPVIVHTHDPDTIWSAGGRVTLPMLRNHHIGLGEPVGRHLTATRVAWATGCALFAALPAWERVGPLDEAFFLYLEDVEWCLRAARAGVETWLVPEAVVHHDVSRTTTTLPEGHLRYYAYRNLYRLAFRHTPPWAVPLVAAELAWTLAKTGAKWLLVPSTRRDALYHARTRAIRDFLTGRWGPAPDDVGLVPVRVATAS